jgi:hypothetical protein
LILSGSEDGSVRQWDLKEVFAGVLATGDTSGGRDAGSKGSIAGMLSKQRSQSIFSSKPRSLSESKVRKDRASTSSKFGLGKQRSESMGNVGKGSSVPDVTPAIIAQFQRAMKPILKTQKVKGQFYPSSFTGKDLVAWVKGNIDGCENSKTSLVFGQNLMRDGAFEIVSGKGVADSSSCILKLL